MVRVTNVGDVGDLVLGDGLGVLVHLVGDALRGGAAVGEVVLDAEILSWSYPPN